MANVMNGSMRTSVEDTSRFYSNYTCKYFPCHKTDSEQFNCIFCYCPMYYLHACLGKPKYMQSGGSTIKDCTECDYSHRPENYGNIIGYLIEMKRGRIKETPGHAERRYRAFFEEVKDAVFITSREGTIIDCNQAMLDLFGYTREEMQGHNARYLYACHDDRQKFQRRIEGKGYVRDYEMKFRRKDGTVMLCLLTVTVRTADNGNILGYQGIMRYVSEHECAEEKKRFSYEPDAHTEPRNGWHVFAKIYG